MHKKPTMPPAGEAILAEDLERMRCQIEDGSLRYRIRRIGSLHFSNILKNFTKTVVCI